MADDRDKRRPKTPPAGVRTQLARPSSQAESWEGDVTGNTPVGDTFDAADTISKINRRVKATMGSIAATQVDIARIDSKVETLAGHVGDLRENVGTMAGKLDVLVSNFEDDREERRQMSHARISAFTAEVDVQRQRALSEIGLQQADKTDRIEARKDRRELIKQIVIKVIAGVGVLWAAFSAWYFAR